MATIRRYQLFTPRSEKSLGHFEWDERTCSFDSWLEFRKKQLKRKNIKYKFTLCYTSSY
jgi:hypothetical protein